MSPLAELGSIAALVRLYRVVAPDIVHHVTAKPILYGGLSARIAGVPAVVHAVSGLGHVFISEGPRARVLRHAIRGAYRVATAHRNCAVIFQNDDDRRVFGRAIRTNNVAMIRGSGVDRHVFRPSPLPTGTPVVVLPSRLLWDKGVGEFVAAAEALRGTAARFVLVGDTDDGNPAAIPSERLRTWVAEGAIEWWGRRTDMPSVLEQASIVCLPSYREGMPKSLLEGLAAGRPIVTTDVPGCRDVITDGVEGRIVPARNAVSLATAIGEMLADRPRLERMAHAAVKASEQFAVEHVLEQTLALYRTLLD